MNIKQNIYNYWQKSPELFSEKYQNSVRDYFSLVNLFLLVRRRRAMSYVGSVKGKTILDVACGSGIFMIDFIKKGAYVVGIDYSQKMLDIAEENLKLYKISKKKYKLQKADATKLPFKSGSFDLLVATGLTDYMSDEQNNMFLKEASRVLKKNSKAIISFPSTQSLFSFFRKGIGLHLRKKFAKLPPIENNFTSKKINKFLKEAGFKVTKKSKIFTTMWIVSARKYD